jgi:membrane protein YqaA with SNARE-associated domain
MQNTAEGWLDRLKNSRHAYTILFFGSFAETLIVPIPIELILLPYMAMNRDRIWRAAAVVLAGCLCAAMVGYGLGYLFFETAGQWALKTFGWQDSYDEFKATFDSHGFWAVFAVGLTPVPFQIGMLAAGATGYNIALFLLAASIARGIRYFGLAALVYFLGERAVEAWRHNRIGLMIVVTLLVALVIGLSYALQTAL